MNDDTRSDLRALLHRLERGARSLVPFPKRKTLRRWFPPFEDRNLVHLLREQGITHVIDVGANTGQFAQKLRYAGYRDAILSVEPVSVVHDTLRAHAARATTWTVLPRAAVGDRDGTVTINILADSTLSSTLTSLHQATIAHETVDLRRLDTLLEEAGLDQGARIALKIDVQGAEASVLKGASATLARARMLMLEMCLIPTYEGETYYLDLLNMLYPLGFRAVFFSPVVTRPRRGRMFQVDVVLVREEG